MIVANSSSALFAGTGKEFVDLAPGGRLAEYLVREFTRRVGTPAESEIKSWDHSLSAFSHVLAGADFDTSGIGVEVRLPLTSRRLDVSVVGTNDAHRPTVMVVELKQWDNAAVSEFPDNVIVGGHQLLHPSIQVGAYVDYLANSHSAFTEDGFGIAGCAFLHNMSTTAASALREGRYEHAVDVAPMFVRGEEELLQLAFLETVGGGRGAEYLTKWIHGRYQPSLKLLDGIKQALAQHHAWTLLDEQRVAFNTIVGLIERCSTTDNKGVVIVTGGPGTGKSVIAAHAVLELGRTRKLRAVHSTASKALTTNLRAIGGKAASAVFRWNMDFAKTKVEENAVDLLVVDEAHRVRKTSNTRWTSAKLRSDATQAEEIVRAARVSVFLLDERQSVRPDEIGSVEEILQAARKYAAEVHRIALDAQFRCNGSQRYIDWVDQLLSSTPVPLDQSLYDEYNVEVFDTPAALEAATGARCRGIRQARIIAGFCWPWSDPLPDGRLVADVRIGDWQKPWNEKSPEQRRKAGAQPRPDRHPYFLWANDASRFDEVGCVYSAQGFEFDYCGVIFGDDLVWRSGRWEANKSASHDPAIMRTKWVDGELERKLQQVYRVLLTRGMLGTFLYSTDRETQELFRRLIQKR